MNVFLLCPLDEPDNCLKAEIATKDDSGNEESEGPRANDYDYSNTALTAYSLKLPIVFSQNDNNLETIRSFGSDLTWN